MTSYLRVQSNASVPSAFETAREQLSYARAEMVLGAQRVLAQAAPSLDETRLMATAIVEYFAGLAALEAAEAEERGATVAGSR
jgi:hypothetical protein